jgi:hypothetical protein
MYIQIDPDLVVAFLNEGGMFHRYFRVREIKRWKKRKEKRSKR